MNSRRQISPLSMSMVDSIPDEAVAMAPHWHQMLPLLELRIGTHLFTYDLWLWPKPLTPNLNVLLISLSLMMQQFLPASRSWVEEHDDAIVTDGSDRCSRLKCKPLTRSSYCKSARDLPSMLCDREWPTLQEAAQAQALVELRRQAFRSSWMQMWKMHLQILGKAEVDMTLEDQGGISPLRKLWEAFCEREWARSDIPMALYGSEVHPMTNELLVMYGILFMDVDYESQFFSGTWYPRSCMHHYNSNEHLVRFEIACSALQGFLSIHGVDRCKLESTSHSFSSCQHVSGIHKCVHVCDLFVSICHSTYIHVYMYMGSYFYLHIHMHICIYRKNQVFLFWCVYIYICI